MDEKERRIRYDFESVRIFVVNRSNSCCVVSIDWNGNQYRKRYQKKFKEELQMILSMCIAFGLGTVAGAVVACINSCNSYGKGYKDGYNCAWKTRDIVDSVR